MRISVLYNTETNKYFIEIVTCVALNCKGRSKFLEISKGRKSETVMAHENKT